MSVHKECGESVRWARNQNDTKWLPPLEAVGDIFILTRKESGDGDYTGSELMGYRIHQCDPDKVVAWQEYKAKLEALEARKQDERQTQYISDRDVARARDQENAWDLVHGTPCPRSDLCHTDGVCYNLSKAKKGEMVATLWPHPERVEAASDGRG